MVWCLEKVGSSSQTPGPKNIDQGFSPLSTFQKTGLCTDEVSSLTEARSLDEHQVLAWNKNASKFFNQGQIDQTIALFDAWHPSQTTVTHRDWSISKRLRLHLSNLNYEALLLMQMSLYFLGTNGDHSFNLPWLQPVCQHTARQRNCARSPWGSIEDKKMKVRGYQHDIRVVLVLQDGHVIVL